MNKKRFLKSILATSALAAAIAPGATFAANQLSTNAAAQTGQAHWNPGPVADGDNLQFRANAESIILDTLAAESYQIDFQNKNGGTVRVDTVVTITDFVNPDAGNLDNKVTLNAGVAATISAQGTINAKGVESLDAAGKAGSFVLAPGADNTADYTGVTFSGDNAGAGGAAGTFQVANGTVTLGTFNATANKAVNVLSILDGATAITSGNIVTGTNTKIAGDGVLQVTDTHNTGLVQGSGANEGHVEFLGKSTATLGGAGNSLKSVKTAAGEVTLTGAATATKGLEIGSGGITTDQNMTIGADGVIKSTGDLTFTVTGKTLSVAGNYANTGRIHLNKVGGAALTYTAAHNPAGNSAVDASFTTENDAVDTLNFAAANQANQITINKDIGAADKQWKFVNLNGAGTVPEVILNGKKVYVSDSLDVAATAHGNKLTFKGASEIVGGKLTASNAAAIIQLDGENTKAAAPVIANGKTFAEFNILEGAKNAILTIGSTDADRSFTITDFSSESKLSGDTSGLTINLSGIATKGNAFTLTVNGSTITNDGAHGAIRFVDSKFKADDAINLTLGGALGVSATKHLALVDATGHKLKITNNALHVKDLKATEVQLDNATLGLYNKTTTNQVSKLVVNASNGAIADGSYLKDGTVAHFETNNSLTLGKSVAFKGSLTNKTKNEGTLVLNAAGGQNVNLTAAGATDQNFNLIHFKGGADTEATLELGAAAGNVSELRIEGATDTAKLKFKGNLKGSVTKFGAGTIVLQGGSVQGNFGAGGNVVNKVEIDTNETILLASDATAKTVHAAAVVFKEGKNGGIEIHKNSTGVSALGAVTTETANSGRLIFNQNYTTAAAWGTDLLPLQSVTVNENKTFTVGAGDAFHATNVVTGVNGQGTFTFAGGSVATKTSIGSAEKRFAQVNTGAGVVDLTDIYSTKLALGAALTARHVNVTDAGGITGAHVISVRDGGSITGKTAGGVTTLGSATLNSDIAGALNTTASVSGKVVELNASKVTGAATLGGSTLALGRDVAFGAAVTGTNSVIDFGSNQMTAAGNVTLNGVSTLSFDGSKTPIISNQLTFANALNLEIDSIALQSFKIAQKADGSAVGGTKLTNASFNLVNNEFYKGYTVDDATKTVTLVFENDPTKIGTKEQLADEASKKFIEEFASNLGKISADDPINEWGREYRNLSSSDKNTIVKQLATIAEGAGDANAAALNTSNFAATARVQEVTAFADAQGVAAGDAADKFGVWAKGTFGNSTQKLRKGVAGYKSNSYGAFVGVDTMLNDGASAGLMVGYSNDKMKMKDFKAGGKIKANSWMFGAYGTYDLPQNFFVQGSAAIAQTSVKVNEAKLAATSTGKYDVVGYTADVRGGYKLRFDNSLIVPTAGLRLNYLGDTSYTETGAGLNNRKVAGESRTGIDAVAGVTLSTALDVDGMVLNPEVHMNVDYKLSGKAAKVDYNLDGSNVKFNYKGSKPAKFGYNFGASVMTQADNIEYGVGYDARISDKYLGHTGSVKVKVNF